MLSSLCLASPIKRALQFQLGALFNIGWLDLRQALAVTKYPLVDVGVFTNTPELKNKTDNINPKSVKYL